MNFKRVGFSFFIDVGGKIVWRDWELSFMECGNGLDL